MYKHITIIDNVQATGITRLADNAFIPFDSANKDYVQFLLDWEAGAEVLNADGTPAPYVAPETP